jgi:hypothetical protein
MPRSPERRESTVASPPGTYPRSTAWRRFSRDRRDHRNWRDRIGHRPPARFRRPELAALERRVKAARTLAAEIGRAAVVAADKRNALRGADAVVLAVRFAALKGVIDEIAEPPTDKVVVVPSNPVGIRRAR